MKKQPIYFSPISTVLPSSKLFGGWEMARPAISFSNRDLVCLTSCKRLRYCIWHAWKKSERKTEEPDPPGCKTKHSVCMEPKLNEQLAHSPEPNFEKYHTVARLKSRGYVSMQANHQQNRPGLMNRPIEPVPNLIREDPLDLS